MAERRMIGKNTLDKAVAMYKERYTISSICRFLGIDKAMNYRSAYDIIIADRRGRYHITRPDWLEDEPKVQVAPEGWTLVGGLKKGKWVYY